MLLTNRAGGRAQRHCYSAVGVECERTDASRWRQGAVDDQTAREVVAGHQRCVLSVVGLADWEVGGGGSCRTVAQLAEVVVAPCMVGCAVLVYDLRGPVGVESLQRPP